MAFLCGLWLHLALSVCVRAWFMVHVYRANHRTGQRRVIINRLRVVFFSPSPQFTVFCGSSANRQAPGCVLNQDNYASLRVLGSEK